MLAFLSAGCALFAVGCGGPTWLISPEFGEQTAKRENKPLLLYFKAWDSTQHRDMKLRVFEHPGVKSEMTNTVNVEVEFGFFPEWQQRFHVEASQVCVLCTPQGEQVSRTYVNPVPTEEQFLQWLRTAKAKAKPADAAAEPKVVPQMPPSAPPQQRRQPKTQGPTHP